MICRSKLSRIDAYDSKGLASLFLHWTQMMICDLVIDLLFAEPSRYNLMQIYIVIDVFCRAGNSKEIKKKKVLKER